jgi:hypothetical protein
MTEENIPERKRGRNEGVQHKGWLGIVKVAEHGILYQPLIRVGNARIVRTQSAWN